MRINFDENYYIESDEMNITTYQRKVSKKEDKKEYYVPICYHSNFKQALKSLINKQIQTIDLSNSELIVERINEIEAKIDNLKI